MMLQAAPGLVAVNKKFHGVPCNATPAPGSSHEAQVATRRQTLAAQKRKQQVLDKQNGSSGSKTPEPGAESQHTSQPLGIHSDTTHPDGTTQPGLSGEHVNSQAHSAMPCSQTQEHIPSQPSSSTHVGEPLSCSDERPKKQRSELSGDAADPPTKAHSIQAGKQQQQRQQQQDVIFMSAEVDIVCQGGSVWLEVKNQEPFGLDSEHWASNKGSMKVSAASYITMFVLSSMHKG